MPHTDYVVNLALAKCSMGTIPLPLLVTSQQQHIVNGLAVATELELAPIVNIPCFGVCKVKAAVPPPGNLCLPVPTGWKGANPARKITGLKPLLKKATCQCGIGGTVSFQSSGQMGPAKFQTGPNFLMFTSGNKDGWNSELNKVPLEPNHEYLVDNYLYITDGNGRVVKVHGDLENNKKDRYEYEQGKAGRPIAAGGVKDGKSGDQGGHLIACIFNGPGEQINYLPMTERLNKSDWKRMENAWAREVKKTPPSKVDVEIEAIYGADDRPVGFKVRSWINEIRQPDRSFNN